MELLTRIPFFDFLPEIRNVIYTTNAIESVNLCLSSLTLNLQTYIGKPS